jgi:uncharacterized repeat protein (TIGR04138 family)
MPTNQALEKIRTEIIDSGRDTRYDLNAYHFVLKGLEFYLAKLGERRHVSGQEFSRGLVEFATKQFGPFAATVLERWGIRTSDDFGYIVYNLIDIKQMCKQEGDRLEDFFGVLNIRECCEKEDFFEIDKEYIRSVRNA